MGENRPPGSARNRQVGSTKTALYASGNAALTAVAVKKPYSLRSAKTQTEGGDLNGDVYRFVRSVRLKPAHSKLKIFCVEKHAGERCSLTAALAGDKPSREEVSMRFLAVLKLATQGRVALSQEGREIMVNVTA